MVSRNVKFNSDLLGGLSDTYFLKSYVCLSFVSLSEMILAFL